MLKARDMSLASIGNAMCSGFVSPSSAQDTAGALSLGHGP